VGLTKFLQNRLSKLYLKVFADIIQEAYPEAKRSVLIKRYVQSKGTPIEEQSRQALKLVDGREHLHSEGLELGEKIWRSFVKLKIRPFKEIPSGLARLKKLGWKIFLSTDNPQWVAEKLVDNVGLRMYFDGILGSDVTAGHKEHKVVRHVRALAEKFGIKPADYSRHFAYFGDSRGEMENAKKIGIFGIGRTTSYPAGKMRLAGARRIVHGTGLKARRSMLAYLKK